jgi:hypothetical protein
MGNVVIGEPGFPADLESAGCWPSSAALSAVFHLVQERPRRPA